MNTPFLKKYQPRYFKDFEKDKEITDILKMLMNMNLLNILLIGSHGCGKTSLLDAIVREYYGTDRINKDNILYINNLKEQGIQYYRTEVKIFCQIPSTVTGKKKFIVLDDIDTINDQSQQVFRNCIDKYYNNVFFILSCTNTHKIIDSLQSRCTILEIKAIDKPFLTKILTNIIENEKVSITDDAKEFILHTCNNSIRLLNYKKAIDIIFSVSNKGYSVMDILDGYFTFIKITQMLNETQKYNIIKLICKYISLFHTLHEHDIELAFFTNELNKMIK